MPRSSSSLRLSGELSVTTPLTSSQSSSFRPTSEPEADQKLPTYNPLSDVSKKERSGIRSAENAIHLIPILLLVCAVILWFFSTPV
ncbi:putative Transmembrane protein [Quillaja saponaria]|uniref:Transmembrane protein n=1 Tax=Quillaja saponaria TaxID=32244 RepID=A0AAD7KRV5_QUISA|nr:putative Transmembrane protein [Quillaja saponaria]